MYRVPPHFIGDLERATFSNIEQQSLDYVQNGLLGRARRIEARMASR
jgi:phage portal protein BeeE